MKILRSRGIFQHFYLRTFRHGPLRLGKAPESCLFSPEVVISVHSACQKRSTLSGIVCLLFAIAIVAGPATVMADTVVATGRVKGLDETLKPFVSVSLVGPKDTRP